MKLILAILTYKLVLASLDVGDVHVVGGRAQILQLLAREDVESDEMDLGMPVLSGFRGGHVDNLARTALDDNVPVLPQCRALHGEGGRSASVGGFERMLMLNIAIHLVSHVQK